jgi:hypothetical protein
MPSRVFKTAWFSKAAMKARISDAELCAAIRQVELGQADDLGGGVFKKRLDKNRHRSIILAKAGKFWVFAFLFAKKDRANIDEDELVYFREVAALYREKPERELEAELKIGKIVEICHAN